MLIDKRLRLFYYALVNNVSSGRHPPQNTEQCMWDYIYYVFGYMQDEHSSLFSPYSFVFISETHICMLKIEHMRCYVKCSF